MLNKLKKSNSEGFTIIEVMIVLAIAGLILLVVLLAVPALQRNARNTTAKNDASTVASAINEFESNNNGTLPASITNNSGTLLVGASSSDPNATNGKIQGTDAIAVQTTTAAPATLAAGNIVVNLKGTCAAPTTAATRSTNIYYAVETSGSHTQVVCIDD